MQTTLTITGDFYEDAEQIKTLLCANDYLSSIHRAQEQIRSRIKHGEITDVEERFLDQLQDTLFIEE